MMHSAAIPDPALDTTSLLKLYQQVRTRSQDLCAPLTVEDYLPQPVVFASPPKWHLAHTTWFFEAFILVPHKDGYELFDERFNQLFNSYYNNAGERIIRSDRGLITRPGVEEVSEYRTYVDEAMLGLLRTSYSSALHKLVVLGLNHEQQHQELLLTDLKHTLSLNPVRPVYRKGCDLSNRTGLNDSGSVLLEEGTYEVGYTGHGFCYDNELGVHKVYVHEAEISKALVTNAQYMQFIEDGGYRDFNLWLDDGWSWLGSSQVAAPLYWENRDGEWWHFTLGGMTAINPAAPVAHLNFYECSAFAEWAGLRLPTEFEWEVAADRFNWGNRWEWTNSAYLPYPYFRKAAGAIGEYNGKFMINQMVLRGASVATSPGHSRRSYRNFFHADARWQFSGFRMAKST